MLSVVLLTGDLMDGIWSPRVASVSESSGDVMEELAPAKGFSKESERRAGLCLLKMVESWRRAGMEATMMPMFCSRLALD